MDLTKQTILLFWRLAWRYPRHVIGLIVGMPVTILFHQYLPALIIATVLNRLSTHQYVSGDIWGSFGQTLIIYAVVFFLGNVVFWRLMIVVLWKLEGLVTRDISRQVFEHLMKMSANFHANRFGGSIVSQAGKLTGSYVRFADTTILQTYSLILSLSLRRLS
jgi:ATP-binding cassette subfamily B protein